LNNKGKFLNIGSACAVVLALTAPAFAVTHDGRLKSELGQLSWPNPHHYVNFITSGEYCTSTHFTCERPDYDIQTASISDVPEFGDIEPIDAVKKSASRSARRSSGSQNGGSGGDGSGGIGATSSAGGSPAGSFNGGGAGRSNFPILPIDPIDPPQPIDPVPPNLSPVPLPSSVWFLFVAVLSLVFFRHQSARIGNQQKFS
jgi:hypothetical protein